MQVGDSGIVIELDTQLDLSAATSMHVRWTMRDAFYRAYQVDKDLGADALVGGTKSVIQYPVEGEFTVEGLWQVQVSDTTEGRLVHSAVGNVYIAPNL